VCIDRSMPLTRWQRFCRTWPLCRFVNAYYAYRFSREDLPDSPLSLRQVFIAAVCGQWGNYMDSSSRPLIRTQRLDAWVNRHFFEKR
jgi:hypothetical protein